LQLNASVYDIRWNNIQESVDDACGNRFTTNSGAARSTGFDIDAEAVLTDRLRVSMAVGLVDVRYTRTVAESDGTVIVDRGTQVGGVPSVPAPWSGTVSARYEWPLEAGTVYVGIENIVHSHNSGPFFRVGSAKHQLLTSGARGSGDGHAQPAHRFASVVRAHPVLRDQRLEPSSVAAVHCRFGRILADLCVYLAPAYRGRRGIVRLLTK
jgi:hypothetical protein